MTFAKSACVLAILALSNTVAVGEAPATQPTYKNPLPIELADPFIFRDGATYYLYGTAASDGFDVWTSSDLVNWTRRGMVFRRSPQTWSRRDFWAPELFKHRDKFYLHFTAMGGTEQDRRRRRVVLARGDSPLGPFHEIKAPWFEPDGDARPIIDGHVFRDEDGQLYLYTVALDLPPRHKCFEIHVRRLDDDLNVSPEATLCISPTLPWEGSLVNEGPIVLRRGDTYLLTWSANPYWDRNYSVGIATARSPLGPWTKLPDPILKASDTVSGPGHHCFVESPDGKELFIAYHVHRDANDGRAGRMLAIDRARIVEQDGRTTIHVDGPTDTPQPLPSGAAR